MYAHLGLSTKYKTSNFMYKHFHLNGIQPKLDCCLANQIQMRLQMHAMGIKFICIAHWYSAMSG